MFNKQHTDKSDMQGIFAKQILTFKETLFYLGVSQSFLYKLTSAKKIVHFKPSGKLIYFKREDLDNWMLQNRCKSITDIEYSVNSYLQNSSKV